ncbi:IPT/TIG domain-containing protein [Flavobacterium sp. CF136]|uniref:IPT/TIG domain-containing protein n=1 Tax=Flavobacterium sp. (strain CF136) TaxID=1144313 RepID=UPI0002F7E1B8|nr:IPT/TIG domain-containing protein [Flavobacterium sp. CF136]
MVKKILLLFLFCTILVSCSSNDSSDEDIKTDDPTNIENKETTVASVSPVIAKRNSLITITGTNFGTNVSDISIFFGEIKASVQSVKENEITVLVPNKVTDPTIRIVKNNNEFKLTNFDYIPTVTFSYVRKDEKIYANTQLFPGMITIDKLGNIYFTGGIDKIDSGGKYYPEFLNGVLDTANAIATDSNNNIYVIDVNGYIYKFTPSGVLTRPRNNEGALIRVGAASGMCLDSKNNLYISEDATSKIMKLTPTGILTIFAGANGTGFQNGNIKEAKFSKPSGIVFDKMDNLYVVDRYNNRIRKIAVDGTVSTVAGSGIRGNKDGITSEATFNFPQEITIDKYNNLYIVEPDNNRIRMITSKGNVITINFNEFYKPGSIAMNIDGRTLFVSDWIEGDLRKMILE